jgi:3-oxoacyl-[acyl-carrier-protein] synthase-3
VYALALSDALIRSRALRTVLVIASEALTPLVDYTDRSTCVLFGDGAAAAVVGSGGGDGGIRAVRWAADGAEADLIYYGVREDDPDGGRAIRMAGRGTFRSAVTRFIEVSELLLADAGWTAYDIDWFIPHQANLRIIEATAKRLGVPMERVIVNVDRVGNTSAASIPIALHEAAAAGRLRPGQRVVSVAFGSGVTWGGVAIEWTAQTSR